MTLNEAIHQLDALEPNSFSDSWKRRWLSELDGQLYLELHALHHEPPAPPAPYGPEEGERQLLVPEPFAGELYRSFLQAQLARENGETARYNRCIALFHSASQRYQNHYRRQHMPRSAGDFFYGGAHACLSQPARSAPAASGSEPLSGL